MRPSTPMANPAKEASAELRRSGIRLRVPPEFGVSRALGSSVRQSVSSRRADGNREKLRPFRPKVPYGSYVSHATFGPSDLVRTATSPPQHEQAAIDVARKQQVTHQRDVPDHPTPRRNPVGDLDRSTRVGDVEQAYAVRVPRQVGAIGITAVGERVVNGVGVLLARRTRRAVGCVERTDLDR